VGAKIASFGIFCKQILYHLVSLESSFLKLQDGTFTLSNMKTKNFHKTPFFLSGNDDTIQVLT